MLLHTKNICKNVSTSFGHGIKILKFTSIFISIEIGLDFQLFLNFPEFDLDLHGQFSLILQMLVEKMMDGFLLILILEHLL